MVAKQLDDDEPQTLNYESKSHNKKHKRKLEDPEVEEVVVESKKENKKKKQEGYNGNAETLCAVDGNTEIFDGSAVVSEKKKKKKKGKQNQEQEGYNGNTENLCEVNGNIETFWGVNGNAEIFDGSAEVSGKKKKKKRGKQNQEQEGYNGNTENLSGANGNTETFLGVNGNAGIFDGSAEVSGKKKKKKRGNQNQEHEGYNGNTENLSGVNGNTETFWGVNGNAEIFDGSAEVSEKKKKEKKKKQEQEGCNGNTEIFNGSTEFSEKKKIDGSVVNGEVKESSTNVVVNGKGANESKYKALSKFVDSGLPSEVLECCKNFEKPSPIQSHSWPFLLDGRDFIGIARTGSGKTLAFGIPAIMHIMSKRKTKKSKNPVCLVLSPTRELAQQISDVLCEAGKPTGVQSVVLYGGVDKHHQKASLRSGVDIVIGTPGRLQDMMEIGACNLKEVSFVVLDEADRMLDLGFEPAVRAILSQTCSVRQMVMFSATWPPAVHQLAQEFMDPNPIKVVVGSEDLAANHDVMQIVEVLEDRARDERLQCLLEKYHKSRRNRVLVFVLYKKEASRVEMMLQKRGWKVVSISGDKQQHARTKALSLFKDGSCPLMIATDVAARGLDIPDVEVVINYSFPLTTEDYVHRIGRTGRAGKKGVAHTFFTKDNKGLSGELINVLREAGQTVPAALLNFGTHVKKKESKLYGAHFREIDANAPKATKIKFGDSDNED